MDNPFEIAERLTWKQISDYVDYLEDDLAKRKERYRTYKFALDLACCKANHGTDLWEFYEHNQEVKEIIAKASATD